MISFDFEYYKPTSIIEAVNLFQYLHQKGKKPIYYAGGTEIITRARRNDLSMKAVIDIKAIPECTVFQFQNNKLIIGAVITLTHLSEVNVFPLLSRTSSGAADHTARNKITLGGNISGRIIYREAVLPFLLSNSQVVIAGPKGIKYASIHQVFKKTLQVEAGEFLVQVITDKNYINLPYVVTRKTKIQKVEYPLATIAAIKRKEQIRTAFSGVCSFPFRSLEMEKELNDRSVPLRVRIDRAISHLPGPLLSNVEGTAEYRKFVLGNTLEDILEILEGERGC
ncbi:FAD binding domain-containing protein [Aneurinibacillus aneurinilyticus]|uniref:Xanthine dehydrogenase n=1 Tax=Aneurinibacillus aneurinilyticus TaxID=1391 RepID=A0A848CV01_ANEAE|nr:xanthine dehydrogenase [Aneurinibacillus aneurinilyticus]